MKINNNKLSQLLVFYTNQLKNIYHKDEIIAIFELVCGHFLGFTKNQIKLKMNENINQSDLINIYNTCNELKTGIPVQYVLNEAYFYNLKFYVNKFVLIPRPETEELVEIVLNYIKNNKITSVLDIGTGTGCIPISIKKNIGKLNVFGLDISEEALEIASLNAKANFTEVIFSKTDILNTNNINNSIFDIIISNPPYILKKEALKMENHVLNYEPSLALFVEDSNPIIFYKKIIDLCLSSLSDRGVLFFELNPLFANDVKDYADNSKLFSLVEIINDMSSKQRFLIAQK